jgi:hypothetical protein
MSTPIVSHSEHAMLGKSKWERVANDFYGTIDERCVAHLVKVFPQVMAFRYHEPCAGIGHLMWELDKHGAYCEWASDLYEYFGADERIRTGIDVFGDGLPKGAQSIITNPPFAEQRPIVHRLLTHAPQAWVILLMRTSQMQVKEMLRLLPPRFHALAPLPFRPMWFNNDAEEYKHKQRPRHEYAWYIWKPLHMVKREIEPPVLLFRSET